MTYEVHHGGNSLNNMAQLHFACAIRNTTYFEVLLPHGAHKYGLLNDIQIGKDGLAHCPRGARHRRPVRFRPHQAQADRAPELTAHRQHDLPDARRARGLGRRGERRRKRRGSGFRKGACAFRCRIRVPSARARTSQLVSPSGGSMRELPGCGPRLVPPRRPSSGHPLVNRGTPILSHPRARGLARSGRLRRRGRTRPQTVGGAEKLRTNR